MDWLLRWETNSTDIQEQSIHKGEGRKKIEHMQYWIDGACFTDEMVPQIIKTHR